VLSSELQSLARGRALRLCFAGREEIGTNPISCPLCNSANIRRSKRRGVRDYLLSVAGILPWRCESCSARFHARLLPFRTLLYAHCKICGNLELQRISAERITGVTSTVGRLVGIRALRCEPCRHKFFSVRPLRREGPSAAGAPNK
jgi:hypothetical protein